jgi:hypothetical protein
VATLLYARPTIFKSEQAVSLPIRDFSAAAGHTGAAIILPGDLITLTAGVIARAATNANANLAGFAVASELATYGGTQATWSQDAYDNLMFGFSQVGTLLPINPAQVPTVPITGGAQGPIYVELNATALTGWITGGTYQANIGTVGGLLLDPVSNLYVFDPSQTNKVLTIYQKPQGPFQGVNGDLAPRVRCYFNQGTV